MFITEVFYKVAIESWPECLCYLYVYIYIYIYVYISIYTISYTLIVVNISFFHGLMSCHFKINVQSCVNLNGTNRKENRTQQQQKFY